MQYPYRVGGFPSLFEGLSLLNQLETYRLTGEKVYNFINVSMHRDIKGEWLSIIHYPETYLPPYSRDGNWVCRQFRGLINDF
jgi:hypothetical protein